MRILHVFRTPVGGLFRHVRDLVRGQAEEGHETGILCDSATGGLVAEQLLGQAASHCALGIARIPISRLPGLSDIAAARLVATHARALAPDIIHCHGAKGGLYGRAAARWLGIASVYTPHGGSLHYEWRQPQGMAFLATERLLAAPGTGLHFVCAFERQAFARKVGIRGLSSCVVHNGLWPEEFAIVQPAADAADLLFMGDMRLLKGVDVLLDALAVLGRERPVTARLIGDGPDLERFMTKAGALGLEGLVTFPGRMPAPEAFRQGRILVMPSLAESFPYAVLEAMAAGLPILASAVGGIPEALPPHSLVKPGDAVALAAKISSAIAAPDALAEAASVARKEARQRFDARRMTGEILNFYRELLRRWEVGH